MGIDLGTSEDDVAARALYERAGFTNREGGPAGPRMLYYERDLWGRAPLVRHGSEDEREHCGGALRRLHAEGAASAVTS